MLQNYIYRIFACIRDPYNCRQKFGKVAFALLYILILKVQ